MAKYKVEFYEKQNGKVPVEEFLNGLDKKMRAKLLGIINITPRAEIELAKKYRKDYLERYGKNEKI